MKLFTKDIDRKLFAQYPKGASLDIQYAVAKIFNPYGRGRWYLLNSDPNDPDYIWAIVQMGNIVEMGSVSRRELEQLRVSQFRLPLERDLGFRQVRANELYVGLTQGKFYKKGGWVEANVTNEMRGESADEYGTFELYKRGGKVDVKILNRDEAFSRQKYNWLLGDFDSDGLANVDDKSPYDAAVRDRIDSPSIEKGINTILDLKNTMDKNMYSFVEDLKNISPDNSKIYARTKTPYSIIDKLIKKRLLNPKTGLTDLIGTTIVTNDKKELDAVKKVIESGKLGRVIELEDMYANPKQGYRAYHFLVEKNGMPIELQLKTKRQKALNELSHEPYKLGELNADKLIAMTGVANKADNGDKAAAAEYDKFMKQPNIERAFYQYANGGYLSNGGTTDNVFVNQPETEDATIENDINRLDMTYLNGRGSEDTPLTVDEVKKLYAVGYDFKDLQLMYFGLFAGGNKEYNILGARRSGKLMRREDTIIEGNMDGLKEYTKLSRERFIQKLIAVAKRGSYEIGLKYPTIDWDDIKTEYNISAKPELVNFGGEDYYVWRGKGIVITGYAEDFLKNGGNRGIPALNSYPFGYCGIICYTKDIMYNVARKIMAKRMGYVKKMELFVNGLGGLTGYDWGKILEQRRMAAGQFAKGGVTDGGNAEMLRSNAKAISHHAKELQSAAKGKGIEAWVVAKSERAATDLSDVTHYLDGREYAKGGYMEGGGKTFQLKKGDKYFSVGMDGGFKWNESPDLGYTYEKEDAETIAKQLGDRGEEVEITKYNKDWWKMGSGGYMEKGGSPKYYIEFLNKKKGFKRDKKEFSSYEDAIAWGRKNLENFNSDMVRMEYANGGYMKKGGITGDLHSLTNQLLAQKIEIFIDKVKPIKYYFIDEEKNSLIVGLDENYTTGMAEKLYKEAKSSMEFFDAESINMENNKTGGIQYSIGLKKEAKFEKGGMMAKGGTIRKGSYFVVLKGMDGIKRFRIRDIEGNKVTTQYTKNDGTIITNHNDKKDNLEWLAENGYIKKVTEKEYWDKKYDNYANGGYMEKGGSPKYYIEFLNKKKGFKRDKKEFSSYEDAIAWGRKNLENFNSDMIRMEFSDGGYMAKGGETGVDKHRVYFSSFAEVMEAIHDIAADNGYKVVEIFPDLSYGGVSYGQTKRAKAELEWDGNAKKGKSKNREKNSMNIQIYRMDSGSYELNTYFSYAEGGKVGFSDKVKAIKKSLLKRKKVSPSVQKDYGKTYSPKEAEASAKRIAGAMTASQRLKARMAKK